MCLKGTSNSKKIVSSKLAKKSESKQTLWKILYNPLVPSATKCMNCQNFDSKIRRDHQKISYERRDYESVDEKSSS